MKYIMNVENEAETIKQPYDVLYYIKPLGSMKIITTPRYTAIDLGLPSGRLWANMNVGAEKETDYGKYLVKVSEENIVDEFEETRALVESI